MFGQLSINGQTLDLDSTVMTRYGMQQGVARGYNPAIPKFTAPSRQAMVGHLRRHLPDCIEAYWLENGVTDQLKEAA